MRLEECLAPAAKLRREEETRGGKREGEEARAKEERNDRAWAVIKETVFRALKVSPAGITYRCAGNKFPRVAYNFKAEAT